MDADIKKTQDDYYKHRGQRETDVEIKEIRQLISDLYGGSKVNEDNLENISNAYKELANANSATHFTLFAKTENLSINLKELETRHTEHIKHGNRDSTEKRHRYTMFVSWVAIVISIATVGVLIIQALKK